MSNFQWFFTTPVYVRVFLRTLWTAALVTSITLLVAYPYSYFLTVVSGRVRLVLFGAVLVPFWTSALVRNFAWVVILQDNGLLNRALSIVHVGPVDLLGTITGVTIGEAQTLLPFMILPLYATFLQIDQRLLTAAQSLGAPPLLALLHVFVPLSMPGVFAGSVLVFVISLGFFITPAMLGSPQQSLLSQQIVTQVSDLLAYGRGGAMATVLLVATILLLAIVNRVFRGGALPGSSAGDEAL